MEGEKLKYGMSEIKKKTLWGWIGIRQMGG